MSDPAQPPEPRPPATRPTDPTPEPEPGSPDPAPPDPDATEPVAAQPMAAQPADVPASAAPGAGRDRRRSRVAGAMRSSWLPPLATGLVGLVIGLVIGAAVVGLVATIAGHHRHGPGPFRDGHHWQDDRRPLPPRVR